MDENTFDKVVQFFMSFVADFCKKSTARELPSIMNVMAVYNMFGPRPGVPGPGIPPRPGVPGPGIPPGPGLPGPGIPPGPGVLGPRVPGPRIPGPGHHHHHHQNYSLSQHINDQQLTECIRKGLEYVKANLAEMQNGSEGIAVAGGSIESWRFENISLDIISQDTRLQNTADYNIEGINVNLAEGKVHVGVRWPIAHLMETYILRGIVDNKRVYGAGRFRISVVNFTLTALCYFTEEENTIRMRNTTLTSDFEDAQIAISGLEVEGNDNAEQLMNNAIQRDKQTFREILHRNMEALSKEVLVVLNLHLSQTHKNSVYELVTSWCRL